MRRTKVEVRGEKKRGGMGRLRVGWLRRGVERFPWAEGEQGKSKVKSPRCETNTWGTPPPLQRNKADPSATLGMTDKDGWHKKDGGMNPPPMRPRIRAWVLPSPELRQGLRFCYR